MIQNNAEQTRITGLLVSLSWENGMVRIDLIADGPPERWAAAAVGTNITISTVEAADA